MKKKNKKKFPVAKNKHRAPHRTHPAAPQKSQRARVASGIFRGTSRGFGFLHPDEDCGVTEDIFIPAPYVGAALDGDSVKVRYRESEKRGGRTGLEGEVLSVLKEERTRVIGTFCYESGFLGRRRVLYPCIVPDDSHLPSPMRLRDGGGAREGEKVEITLPLPRVSGDFGKITRIFGEADDRGANYEAILAACEIPTEFPEKVAEEAREIAALPLSEEGRTRPSEIIFTIDGESAKDLDDAVSLRALPNGNWLLGVHIADVSEYVQSGSALDREATARGTSVYFVDKVVPMLPRELSNGACSLNAGEDKYALAAHMKIDGEGNILETVITREIIRSRVRGVYSEVNDLLAKRRESAYYAKYREVLPVLERMEKLYAILAKKSEARGALELERPEAAILLNQEGEVSEITLRERGVAERMIEQFMLAANEGVARLLTARGIPCVYRVHDRPDPDRMRELADFAHNLGLHAAPLAAENADAHTLAALLEEGKEKGVGAALSYTVLRTMAKAEYSERAASHFGLGMPLYCHFTSPIRRLSDLATHRIIKAVLLDGDTPARYTGYARHAAEAASACELRALDAERQIEALYKTLYLSHRIGEEYDATVSSVASFGMFCELDNTCEGLVPIESLSGSYTFEEKGLCLRGQKTVYRIGDRIRVRVEDADITVRRVRFSVVGDCEAEDEEELPDLYSFDLPYAPRPRRSRR